MQQMKRLLIFILAFSYLVTTTGADMHLHFCMGKLAGWSFWAEDEKTACDKCGMEKEERPDGCCKDESKWMKIQDDQKVADQAFSFAKLSPAAHLHFPVYNAPTPLSATAGLHPQSHAPPRGGKVESYILNCTFRI